MLSDLENCYCAHASEKEDFLKNITGIANKVKSMLRHVLCAQLNQG